MSAPGRTVEVAVALPWGLGIGKAAELAGLPRAAFMCALGRHGVPVIDYAADELERELGTFGPG